MKVVRPTDAAAFLELAGPLLDGDEARHNLILGIAGTLLRTPEVYPVFHLWIAMEAGRPVGAALQTEPHNLVLADPGSDEALDTLLAAVREDGASFPGLVGNVPHAYEAARRWAAIAGVRPETRVSEGVYELTSVREVPRPPGGTRVATSEDRPLLVDWNRAFLLEALPEPERDLEDLDQLVDSRLGAGDSGTWLWEVDGIPVSLAGYGGRTTSGIRVGPVYTPLEHRRRGYATALVADLSRFLLDGEHRACFLFTDLSNPTANRIYADIGYERVCDAAMIRFRDP